MICADFGAKYAKYYFCTWEIGDGQEYKYVETVKYSLCLAKADNPCPLIEMCSCPFLR